MDPNFLLVLAAIRVATYLVFALYSTMRHSVIGRWCLTIGWATIAFGSLVSAYFNPYFRSIQLIQTPVLAIAAIIILLEFRRVGKKYKL